MAESARLELATHFECDGLANRSNTIMGALQNAVVVSRHNRKSPSRRFASLAISFSVTVLLCASANWKTAKPVPKLRKHFGNLIVRDFQHDFRVSTNSDISMSSCFSGFVVNPRFTWQVHLVAEVWLEHTTIGYEPIKLPITLLRNKKGCVVLGVVHTIVTDQSCRLLLNDFTFSALSHHSVVCPIAPRTLTVTYLCTRNKCIPQSAGRGGKN